MAERVKEYKTATVCVCVCFFLFANARTNGGSLFMTVQGVCEKCIYKLYRRTLTLLAPTGAAGNKDILR
jgi:hypothetical protein